MMKKTIMLLPKEMDAWLRERAKVVGLSKAGIVRTLIIKEMERLGTSKNEKKVKSHE